MQAAVEPELEESQHSGREGREGQGQAAADMGTGRYSAFRTGMGSSLSECKIERYLAVW